MGRLLLVDDDPDLILAQIHQVFGASQLRIDVARTGADGIRRVAERAPDVILLDLRLPKVDRFEVLNRVRSNDATRLLPVVILNEEQDCIRGYDLGANIFVRKPVEFDKFIEAVRQLGLYWLILNEPPPALRRS